MQHPWDRPDNSQIPLRSVDKDIEPLFSALGRAVSAWEGVQAATSALYFSLLDHTSIENVEAEIDAFGQILRVPNRAKAIRDRAAQVFSDSNGFSPTITDAFTAEIKDVTKSYEGWTQRRNDLAHGYITEWQAPDLYDEEQPIVTFYGVLPSHARSKKWFMAEPEYNYIADEVRDFGTAFLALDAQFEDLAERISKARGQHDIFVNAEH